jgi:hypothetical protein
VIAYTIVSRAYVPHARVLARSYAQHHPGERLWALLIDDLDRQVVDADEPFLVLRLSDLEFDQGEIHRMAMLFGGKLIAVIKPWIFEHFLSQGADTVLYIDGDFVIYDNFEHQIDEAGEGVILVPHVLTPIPRDGKDPDETAILGAGMFNAGMFGVGRDGSDFLQFLKDRLSRECVFDAPRMRFNEQRWLDFVPPLFPHRVVRDPGVDVAYWNLHERRLDKRGDKWFAGGTPLRAFHFSSFDPRTRGVGGRYELDPAPRVRVSEDPLMAELCDEYRQQLFSEGFDEQHDSPFGLESLPDGTPVYHGVRALFTRSVLAADVSGASYPPDPFDCERAGEFRSWVRQEFADEGLSPPRNLAPDIRPSDGAAGGPGNPVVAPDGSGIMTRVRTRFRSSIGNGEEVTPAVTLAGTAAPNVKWSIDWLDRMITDDAGEKFGTHIQVLPDRAGFVCHGPRAPLGPGSYRVQLEFDRHTHSAAATPFDQALVVEAFVQGYVIGSRSATFADLETGLVTLEVQIPDGFIQESLLFGVELRILSRGKVNARLTAVLMEALEDGRPALGEVTRFNWLSVMAGGGAGSRFGEEIHTIPGEAGIVVSGPNWRLTPGSYRAEMRTRMPRRPRRRAVSCGAVVFEVVCLDRVLADSRPTLADLAQGELQLEFTITDGDAGPEAQIGICVRTEMPIDVIVSSIDVVRVSGRSS